MQINSKHNNIAKLLAFMLVSFQGTAQTLLLQGPLILRNGSGVMEVRAPLTSMTITMPSASGTRLQGLSTDGVSTLSWSSAGAAALDDLSDAKAGGSNFGGSYIIGHQTTGSIGYEARQNTVMGVDAFKSVTTAARNSAIGFAALTAMQSGGRNGPANVALGYRALASLTSQINSTAVGYAAGQNVTNSQVTAVGSEALGNTVSGTGAVAVGYRAGYAATGQYIVAVGSQALSASSTASYTIAIGNQALGSAVTGTSNLGIGNSAMSALSSGAENVGIGKDALDLLSTGNYNVALGYESGAALVSGSYNVFLGYQSGGTLASSNDLAIDNTSTASPLIYGNFSTNIVTMNGSLALTDGFVVAADANVAVTANAVTIDAGAYSAIQITSDSNGFADVITINNGVNGSLMFIGFTSTSLEQFTIDGVTYSPGANSVGMVACRFNGAWRLVSMGAI